MHTSRTTHKPRTFRSGPYLDTLFRSAERMDEQLQAEICARIKQARVEAGFTLQEAADTLGVTLRAWQNYEAIRVPFRSLTRISEMFGVPEGWILRGEEPAEDGPTLADIVRRLQALEVLLGVQGEATTRAVDAMARDLRALTRKLPRADDRATGTG